MNTFGPLFLSLLLFATALRASATAPASCLNNAKYREQMQDFIDYANANPEWEFEDIPQAQRLFRFMCAQVEPGPYDLSDWGGVGKNKLYPWLALAVQYNFWNEEINEGPNTPPYTTSTPFSWKFMTADTVYTVSNTYPVPLVQRGGDAIAGNLTGLGKSSIPPSTGGGFGIESIHYSDLYVSKIKGHTLPSYKVYSRVGKVIKSIDFLGAINTTSGVPILHDMSTKFLRSNSYPKLYMSELVEVVDSLRLTQLFGICNFVCVNCPSGGTCPWTPYVSRRSDAGSDGSDIANAIEAERARVLGLRTTGVPLHLFADAAASMTASSLMGRR